MRGAALLFFGLHALPRRRPQLPRDRSGRDDLVIVLGAFEIVEGEIVAAIAQRQLSLHFRSISAPKRKGLTTQRRPNSAGMSAYYRNQPFLERTIGLGTLKKALPVSAEVLLKTE
jgi:hypothetical protein